MVQDPRDPGPSVISPGRSAPTLNHPSWRKVARKKSANSRSATYTNIRKDKASKNAEWIIDHGYCSKRMVVNAYAVEFGYDATGTFPPVRPSDHVPIQFSVTLPS